MLNYLKKFAVDIFPSVAATVIGAYIVNHYIVTKPADAPAAAAVSAATPKSDGKAEANDGKPAETTASVSNLPAAGVKARGISEKAVMEKATAERPAASEKTQKADEKAEAKADAKPDINKPDTNKSDANKPDANKSDVKSAESPADVDRRHAAVPREKEKIRVVLPSPIQPLNSSAATAAPAAPAAPPAPVEAATAPEERRDANDLARAAIERLRANGETSPRVAEPARAPEAPKEAPRVANAPVVANAPALRPLPPPVMISGPPAGEPFGQASSQQARPPYADAGDPNRPIPPAEIPASRPLDLRAEMAEPSVRERATAAAEDALSTAKSIFHAVLPK
ncbi:hypothetical protein [Bradyrhizobium archetypum]|uniref:Uncharacterized protein n=1 Tax=Bradyrhizobium archetypum TaxID=2721160 RepID=A0A7Y4M211_9BRAD|nr:hypothetical protein [Bradyrhizobium archetypum]NOJ46951.1 hypothetical protein [Bradyrhizobium archetypum]